MPDDLYLLESVGVEMFPQARKHLVGVLVWDEPEIELGGRLSGKDRLRPRPLVAGGDPGDVARGREQKLLDDALVEAVDADVHVLVAQAGERLSQVHGG